MNLLQVLEEMKKEQNQYMWFRPVEWSEFALTLKDGITYQVPSPNGGVRYMTVAIRELTGQWEIVSPETVIDERS